MMIDDPVKFVSLRAKELHSQCLLLLLIFHESISGTIILLRVIQEKKMLSHDPHVHTHAK